MSSPSESRFRAACDRCHKLKNRCARRQGTDNRCERCERLELDCVYSTGARMGRPPGSQGRHEATVAKEMNNDNSELASTNASRATRVDTTATSRGSHSSQAPSLSSRGGDTSRPGPTSPKRHRHHHHRRRTQSSGTSAGPYYSSGSMTTDLLSSEVTPVESVSSSSGSGIQVPSALLSPLDTDAKAWLEAGRPIDWDHEMTSLSSEHAQVQWPNDSTRSHDALFTGMLDGHASISSATEDLPFLFPDPSDKQVLFSDTQIREHQLVGTVSKSPLLKGNKHNFSPLDRLMRLQDELRELVTSRAFIVGNACPDVASWQHHHIDKGSHMAANDDEPIRAMLSLLTILNELLPTPPDSEATSPSSGEDCANDRVADDVPQQNTRICLHETSHGTGPAFHVNSSTEAQSAVLQVLNCYTYLLQLLDLAVRRLGAQIEQSQQRSPLATGSGLQVEDASHLITTAVLSNGAQDATGPSFQLGGVSLDHFPTLNSELVLFTMIRVIKRIHDMIDLLAFGRTFSTEATLCPIDQLRQPNGMAASSRHDPNSADIRTGGQFSSPVIIAAQAVMTAVYEKEKVLVGRMSAMANGSIRP